MTTRTPPTGAAAPAARGAPTAAVPCRHCGTLFTPSRDDEAFCCAGCEFVSHLIREEGLERFYELKGSKTTAPVKGSVFRQADFEWLRERVETAEKEASDAGGQAATELGLQGISCIGCVWLIEKIFRRMPGALRIHIRAAEGRVELRWRAGEADLPAFAEELRRFGYLLVEPTGAAGPDPERRQLGMRIGLCAAFAMNAMAFTLPRYLGMPADFAFARLFGLITAGSATLALLVGGTYFIRRAWAGLVRGSLHIDLPIALGILAAFAGSLVGWLLGRESLVYFDFVAVFILLMLLGRYLQFAAVERNRSRVQSGRAVPRTVDDPDEGAPIPVEALAPGTRFRVRGGRVVPVASRVRADEAQVSLEWINGEPEPRVVPAGGRLPSGAVVIARDPVLLEADERWDQSLLRRLVEVRPEREARSPLLERVLKAYIAVVLALGIAGAAGWGILGSDWILGLQVMISLFVVSCPCALGVAIPMADELARSSLGKLGVFVRSTDFWSRLRAIRSVVFDKTGTLTLESPVMTDPSVLDGLDDTEAGALAVIASESLHPVCRSIVEQLGERGQRLAARAAPGWSIAEEPGRGTRLTAADGTVWTLGRPGWGSNRPETAETAAGTADGGAPPDAFVDTVFARDGRELAGFRFRDVVRPEAGSAVAALARRGIDLHILSGDRPEKVRAMAAELGIPEPRARGGQHPDDKSTAIEALGGNRVLFIGDGANDSLAVDAAGCSGTPVVDRSILEAKTDFYFFSRGLGFLPRLFETGDRRNRAVAAVFAFAVLYNTVTAAVCLAGWMNPLLAAVLMPISSVVTIAIAAFILRS